MTTTTLPQSRHPQAGRLVALGRPHLPVRAAVSPSAPMAWMMPTWLKTGFAAMQHPPQWWPGRCRQLYAAAESEQPDRAGFPVTLNSLFVSTLTTIPAVVVVVPAAYASRLFPGRTLFFAVLLRNMFRR